MYDDNSSTFRKTPFVILVRCLLMYAVFQVQKILQLSKPVKNRSKEHKYMIRTMFNKFYWKLKDSFIYKILEQ